MGRKKLVRKAEPPSKRRIAWPRWTGFRGKTVWSWLELLIVPLALAVIGLLFTAQQDARQQQIETQRAQAERELAEQRAQDEALQEYLSQMSELMIEKDLNAFITTQEFEGSDETHMAEVHTVVVVARARTSTIISRLDAQHNRSVIRFLSEAGIIGNDDSLPPNAPEKPFSLFFNLNLNGVDLRYARLGEVNFRHADLGDANLSGADLYNADLSDAFLYGINFTDASLNGADLINTTLTDRTYAVG